MAYAHSPRPVHRCGVTLLELILALSLSTLLLMAMGMAINLYFKMLDVRRTSVEEVQISRAVFKHFSDDLLRTVAPYKTDLSGLEAVVANAALASASSAGGSGAMAIVGGGGGGGGNGGGGGGGGGGNGGGGRGGDGGGNGGRGGQGGDDGGGRGGQGGNDGGGRGGQGGNDGGRGGGGGPGGGGPGGGGPGGGGLGGGGGNQGGGGGRGGGNQGGGGGGGPGGGNQGGGQRGGGGGPGGGQGGNQQGGNQQGQQRGGQGGQQQGGQQGGQQGRGQQGGNRGGGGGGMMGGGIAVPTGGGQQAGAAGTNTDPNAAATGSATPATEATNVVNLVGSSTELRFDISRLPRADQFQGIMAADATGELAATDLPSDIKTVVYYLLSEESAATADSALNVPGSLVPSASGRGRGLMRTELDRAVMLYSEASGQVESVYDGGRLLAKEIVGLSFRYHDGSAWSQEWDSKTSGGLPRAVEITLVLQPTYAMSDAALSAQMANTTPGAASPLEQEFRLIINLPSAPLVRETNTETATDPNDPAAAANAAAGASAAGATGASAAATGGFQ